MKMRRNTFLRLSSLISFLLIIIPICLLGWFAHAARFEITNRCGFTVWAAAIPGGGRQLNTGQSWALDVPPDQKQARIWARTNCHFDESGHGRCQTGDCGGLLQCVDFGSPPNTLAEYTLHSFSTMDFYDISLVDGFNVPMEFSPTSKGCTRGVIRCSSDIVSRCPNELRAYGGCTNACPLFKTSQYCCTSGSCEPTKYSRFFKIRCPNAYSYPLDDETSTFMCPSGTNYRIVFCP